MPRPRKKPAPNAPNAVRARQQATIAQLLTTALHYLGEINLPYVLILEGTPKIFTNTTQRHAISLLQETAELNAKVRELRIEKQAEQATGYGPGND